VSKKKKKFYPQIQGVTLHKHKINHYLPCKHLHQLKMRIRLKNKRMKIKMMSHLKRRTLIKGEMMIMKT
jgi:hypothetical protein